MADVWRAGGLTVNAADTLPALRRLVDRTRDGSWWRRGRSRGAVIGAWDGRRASVHQRAVRPDAQRRGTARLLMDEVERWLRVTGATRRRLLVESATAGVAGFYRISATRSTTCCS